MTQALLLNALTKPGLGARERPEKDKNSEKGETVNLVQSDRESKRQKGSIRVYERGER